MLNFTSLKQVNNLGDKIVNEVTDILKVVPGPDVAIANKDHEDIENTRESEMIETAMKIKEGASKWKHTSKWNGWFSQILKGNSVLSWQTLVVFAINRYGYYTPAILRIS